MQMRRAVSCKGEILVWQPLQQILISLFERQQLLAVHRYFDNRHDIAIAEVTRRSHETDRRSQLNFLQDTPLQNDFPIRANEFEGYIIHRWR